jgi:uncharacterized protein YjbJ (UPF0337 family)
MDRGQFEKQWQYLKKDAQHRWSKLTDRDIYQIDGMFDQMAVKLQHRYGYTREQAETEILNWHWDRKGWEASQPKKGKVHKWKGEAHHPNPNEWKPKKRKAG